MKKLLLAMLCVGFFGAADGARAQEKLVPILEMSVGGLMGGVQNGKFVDAKTTFARLRGKNAYSIYGRRGRMGEMTAEVEPPDVPCEDFYSFKSEMENSGGIAVGSNSDWNLAPRAVQTIDLKNAAYLKAASDVLRSKGIVNARPKIRQAFRVDLEGDGRDEVLLAVTSYDGNIQPSAKRGDHSFILLRKVGGGGKAQNIVVAGDFVMKNIKFGAPNKYEISSIADLNGDGLMEIILYGAYYEGSWVETYEMKSGKPTEIKTLRVGCGV